MTEPTSPDWHTAYPRPVGDWTVAGSSDGEQLWGVLDPERRSCEVVEPDDDKRLPGLAAARREGAELVSYRAGRRAVLRSPDTTWVKALRPRRVSAAAGRWRAAGIVAPGLRTPVLLGLDESVGLLHVEHLPGPSLHALVRGGFLDERTAGAVGEALARFHRPIDGRPHSFCAGERAGDVRYLAQNQLGGDGLPEHVPDAPIRWVAIAVRAAAAGLMDAAAVRALRDTAEQLGSLDRPSPSTIVHTDLHDKNILLGGYGAGLIDLDGVAVGRPEIDLANLAVHVRLRSLQAGGDASAADPFIAALLDAYRRVARIDTDLLARSERHVWFRLAVLYRLRRSGTGITDELLERAVCRPARA